MNGSNDNMVAFITGGSRGIGLAIARKVAPSCSHLLVTARTKAHAEAASKLLARETECEVHAVGGDLAGRRTFAQKAKELVQATTSRIDLLVLNAGYFVEGTLSEIPDRDFERNMVVNCLSAHYLVSALLPFVAASEKKRIVFIGSTAAYEPYPLVPTYGVAKWGLRGYATNLRKELMGKGIGVTFLAPGGTLTDMWAGEVLPEGRLLEPDDVGKLVAVLLTLSPQAVVDELIVRPMLGDIHE